MPVANTSSFTGIYSYPVNCSTGTGNLDLAIEEYTTGGSELTYQGDGRWQYNWKTPKNYLNGCRVMYVRFADGSVSPGASFKFK